MPYPSTERCRQQIGRLNEWGALKHEYGARSVDAVIRRVERELEKTVGIVRRLPVDARMAAREPNGLKAIKQLRPKGPRRVWTAFDRAIYRDRVEGALLGRFAGCTLGAPVEFWPVDKMERLAKENGMPFPPDDYWTYVPEPFEKRYGVSPREAYTRNGMDGVPVDDDIAYTLLGLLTVEEFGSRFSVADNGRSWLRYLPYACTAEEVALKNLKNGVPALKAGEKDNPYCEWIGADIRSDPWGYLAPAWPEYAADMAYRDAYLSHRRQGIYGEMYFSAAIAAAFAVDDPVEALRIGLTEIPKECATARAVRWAFTQAPRIRNYKQARAAADGYCKGMSGVHTIYNALLVVWGIAMHRRDFSRVIGEVTAMGMDNDCTAATAGSIVGAVVGRRGIPIRWHRRFNNTVRSYIIKHPKFRIDDLVRRFERQAKNIWETA